MKKFLGIICLMFLSSLAFAETIHLKSGQTVEGKIMERNDEYIKIDSQTGVPVTYYMDEISNIDGAAQGVVSSRPVASDDRKAVQDFFTQFQLVMSTYTQKNNQNVSLIARTDNAVNKGNSILESINDTKAMIKKIEELPTPEACKKYKGFMLKSAAGLQEQQEIFGKVQSAPGEDLMSFFRAAEKIASDAEEWSKKADAEYSRVTQEYNILNQQ